jgi:hypothetical protein
MRDGWGSVKGRIVLKNSAAALTTKFRSGIDHKFRSGIDHKILISPRPLFDKKEIADHPWRVIILLKTSRYPLFGDFFNTIGR